MSDSNPQNLANIMWAFATMDVVPPKELMDGAIQRFMALLPAYNPQGIANTMWSFASLGYFPGAIGRHCFEVDRLIGIQINMVVCI